MTPSAPEAQEVVEGRAYGDEWHSSARSSIAIVAIGRNEGPRLAPCLASLAGRAAPVIYVDSGSTDGSPDVARRAGVTVWQLSPDRPFTAARARNEGLERALELAPGLEFVQFVDGDCEMQPEWMASGIAALKSNPNLAVVCGRVRERNRDQSIYNRLCDLEWDQPAGEVQSCGGNALHRVAAFRSAGGFLPTLIGGEEPELCLRLRRGGWTILRLATEMVVHDANMTQFSQWWRRAFRSGWGYAEGVAIAGATADRYCVRESRSILFWGLLLPVAALAGAWSTHGATLALALAGYIALGIRIYRRTVQGGGAPADARLLATFTVLAKFPQAAGQAQFRILHARGRGRRVIDWRDKV